mgnify:CR=1 FL=1
MMKVMFFVMFPFAIDIDENCRNSNWPEYKTEQSYKRKGNKRRVLNVPERVFVFYSRDDRNKNKEHNTAEVDSQKQISHLFLHVKLMK